MDNRKAADAAKWGDMTPVVSWDQGYFHNRISELITGDPDKNRYVHAIETCGVDRPNVLVLGSGKGHIERAIYGLARCVYGIDYSGGCIRHCENMSKRDGLTNVHYRQADIVTAPFPPRMDVVFASMVLHHIDELERVLDKVAACLRPGGVFVVNEFTGPSLFQWSPDQVRLINNILAVLPPKLKATQRFPGGQKPPVSRPDPVKFAAANPMEAIRSAEILSLIKERFDIIREQPLPGTLAHQLFNYIANNFEGDAALILRVVEVFESHLVKTGHLNSDFTYLEAQPKRRNEIGICE